MIPQRPGRSLALSKLHGLGNDFLVVLDTEAEPGGDRGRILGDGSAGHGPAGLGWPGDDWSGTARRLCHRQRGIGADGLILGTRARVDTGGDPDADPGGPRTALTFRLWNADGGEAEMSGNGIRCLAHAALDAGWVPEEEPFPVLTPAGTRSVSIRRGPGPGLTWATVEMGRASISGSAERCNVGHGQLRVDVGNPHLVILGPDPATVDVTRIGAALEVAEPGGLNVEFVTLGPGRDEVTMRVWERGVGETEACGTGSVAAAVAGHHWGRLGRAVTVHQPGGALAVDLHPDGTAHLSGPSEHIADCVVPW